MLLVDFDCFKFCMILFYCSLCILLFEKLLFSVLHPNHNCPKQCKINHTCPVHSLKEAQQSRMGWERRQSDLRSTAAKRAEKINLNSREAMERWHFFEHWQGQEEKCGIRTASEVSISTHRKLRRTAQQRQSSDLCPSCPAPPRVDVSSFFYTVFPVIGHHAHDTCRAYTKASHCCWEKRERVYFSCSNEGLFILLAWCTQVRDL